MLSLTFIGKIAMSSDLGPQSFVQCIRHLLSFLAQPMTRPCASSPHIGSPPVEICSMRRFREPLPYTGLTINGPTIHDISSASADTVFGTATPLFASVETIFSLLSIVSTNRVW